MPCRSPGSQPEKPICWPGLHLTCIHGEMLLQLLPDPCCAVLTCVLQVKRNRDKSSQKRFKMVSSGLFFFPSLFFNSFIEINLLLRKLTYGKFVSLIWLVKLGCIL